MSTETGVSNICPLIGNAKTATPTPTAPAAMAPTVGAWLTQLGLSEHAARFNAEELTMGDVRLLGDDHLKMMVCGKDGTQKKNSFKRWSNKS